MCVVPAAKGVCMSPESRTERWTETSASWINAVPGPFGRSRVEVEEVARATRLWPVSDDHWRVIQFVRAFFRDNGRAPALVRVARACGLGLRDLERLFPRGVVKTVFELSGLDLPLDMRGCCPFYL